MVSGWQDSLGMFAFLAVELSALFLGFSLLVGALQRHIPAARIGAMLGAGRRRSYLLALGLGAITPFCSCSTIPMLKGLIRARAGFGPMMTFLFASPLLNPVVVALLVATFGAKLALIYVLASVLVSLGAGWLLQVLGFQRHVREPEARTPAACGQAAAPHGCAPLAAGAPAMTLAMATPAATAASGCCAGPPAAREQARGAGAAAGGRYAGLWRETWSDFRTVLPYLLIGVTIGSLIYGYMPTGLMEQYAGPDNPLAIPLAAVIGLPLYIRAEAAIPLAGALMAKGVGAGPVLALIIGSAGASLTELILLRTLFRYTLLAAFLAVVLGMAMIAGYATFAFY